MKITIVWKALVVLAIGYIVLIGVSLMPHAAVDLRNHWRQFQQPVKMAYSKATRTIIVAGTFVQETADELEVMLQKHPDAEYLVLSSSLSGDGDVGQKMAKVVERRKIKTLVVDYCYADCGQVFMSGTDRFMSKNALRFMVGFDASPGDFSAQEEELRKLTGDRQYSPQEVYALVRRDIGSLAGKVRVDFVEYPNELGDTGLGFGNPALFAKGQYATASGIFSQADSSVAIVMSSITSRKYAENLIAHELAHAAFWVKFRNYLALDQLADRRPNLIDNRAKLYAYDTTKKWERRAAAEEAIAAIAGARPRLTLLETGLVSHRAWLRANLFPNLYYSDAEVIFNYILPLRRAMVNES